MLVRLVAAKKVDGPVRHEQCTSARIEECTRQPRERFGARFPATRGVAGRHNDPIGVELEGGNLRSGEQGRRLPRSPEWVVIARVPALRSHWPTGRSPRRASHASQNGRSDTRQAVCFSVSFPSCCQREKCWLHRRQDCALRNATPALYSGSGHNVLSSATSARPPLKYREVAPAERAARCAAFGNLAVSSASPGQRSGTVTGVQSGVPFRSGSPNPMYGLLARCDGFVRRREPRLAADGKTEMGCSAASHDRPRKFASCCVRRLSHQEMQRNARQGTARHD